MKKQTAADVADIEKVAAECTKETAECAKESAECAKEMAECAKEAVPAAGCVALSGECAQILETFILTFLPALPNRHRNVANEVHHVCTTLSRVMLQHFGFRVGLDDLLRTFGRLRYDVFSRDATWDFKRESLRPDALPDLFAPVAPVPAEGRAGYLHVNVNPHVVRALRLTTIPLPPNTNAGKREEIARLCRRIDALRGQMSQGG